MILNETGVRTLGLGTPTEAIGSLLTMDDPERTVEVVGVVGDYHYNTLIELIEALVIYDGLSDLQYALLRTRHGAREAAAARLEAVWNGLSSEHPVDYALLDDALASGPLNELFGSFIRVIGVIGGLAVAISLLGLVGMAATMSRRTSRKSACGRCSGRGGAISCCCSRGDSSESCSSARR